jgi:hypothetical protein
MRFADSRMASHLLGRPDDWARQLSAFERSARMRTLQPATTQEFLDFVSESALDWTPSEQEYWGMLVDRLSDAVAGLNLRVPNWFMVKTTGLEEFGFVYSRHNGIMLPSGRLAIAGDERRDFFLLAHELFHLLSAINPSLRHDLYELLGFVRFDGFTHPPELEGRRLSNPGGHYNEHALSVQTANGMRHVIPVVQSSVPLEEIIQLPTSGPPAVAGVLEIVLLPVDVATGQVMRDAAGNVIRYGFGNTDWVQRMARNSDYIIHPEELMADNFALLIEWRLNGVPPTTTPGGFPVADQGLLRSIEEVLTRGCA